MQINKSTVLITGGSLGIGKATAKHLTKSGARVAITGRHEERLHAAAKETGAFPIVADVSDPADIERTYTTFMEKMGRLDCLVNNAGFGISRPLEALTMDDFEGVFRTNVFGAALMAARAVPIFKEQDYGNIVNIGSTAAVRGFERGSVYAASKFALRGMTLCWQAELRRHNVRVFLVNPSEVATAFGSGEGVEREAAPNKLSAHEIAHAIVSTLQMADRGFIPELEVWATNPW